MTASSGKNPLDSLIKVGEALPINLYTKNGFLLLGKGHYVLTDKQKDRLLAHSSLEATQRAQQSKPDPTAKRGAGPAELLEPFEEVHHITPSLDYLLNCALSEPMFELKLRELAERLIGLCDKVPDGLLASMLLLPIQRYTAAHSIHTAILAALISKRLDTPADARLILIAAALTMNLSIAPLMDELYSQATALTPEQQEEVAGHPLLSSAILRECGVTDELWHTLVQQHHEEWDGSGYPQQLERADIHPLAHLLHLSDISAAKLVPRSYRKAILPQNALAQLFQNRDQQVDSQYVTLLVKEMGVYPPGSFVRLASHELGVVVARRERADQPLVAALRREDGAAYGGPLLRETRQKEYQIVGMIPLSQVGIRPQYLSALWKKRKH
jgi:hypothetical protein